MARQQNSSGRKLVKRAAKNIVNRFDFIKAARWLGRFEPGFSFAQAPGRSGPAFSDQDAISRLAVNLAEQALAKKGEPVSRQELESQADLISCRYDFELHQAMLAPSYNIINQFFEPSAAGEVLVSADKRELKHLPELKRARAQNMGVIYLINHSSHWDEFLVNLFLERYGIELPLFAAGQNMMVTPSLERIFMLGSYVIVRKGAGRAYLSTLFHYCQALSELGKQQGIFLEAWSGGARTRDGSLRYPRRLVALQGALASRQDVLIQPIAISYSRVPEDLGLSEGRGGWSWLNGNRCLRELLKKPWQPLKSLARGVKGLYGRAYLTLGRPRLLSDLKTEHEADNAEVTLDEMVALYSIKEIAREKKIMASGLVASALMVARKSPGLSLREAAARELDNMIDYHRRTFGQDPDLEDIFKNESLEEVIKDGLNSLKRRRVIGPKPLFRRKALPKVLAPHGLAYYATHADRRLYSPSARENLVIHGAGPFGYGLVSLIGRRTLVDKRYHNSSLTWYDPRPEVIDKLVYDRTLIDFFPDQRLPKNVFPSHDHTAAYRKATEVILAVPPDKVAEALKTILTSSAALRTLILASRGFDRFTHRLPIQIAWEASVALKRSEVNIVALSSPVSPRNLVLGEGGLVILAGDTSASPSLPQLFNYDNYQVFLSPDPVGVQVAAALSDAFIFYGQYLFRLKEFKSGADLAGFARQAGAEAISLALALGGQLSTFQADSPAWITDPLAILLTTEPEGGKSVRLAAAKGSDALKEWALEAVSHEEEERELSGYYSLHSAYLTAKHLGLHLPLLTEANRRLWV